MNPVITQSHTPHGTRESRFAERQGRHILKCLCSILTRTRISYNHLQTKSTPLGNRSRFIPIRHVKLLSRAKQTNNIGCETLFLLLLLSLSLRRMLPSSSAEQRQSSTKSKQACFWEIPPSKKKKNTGSQFRLYSLSRHSLSPLFSWPASQPGRYRLGRVKPSRREDSFAALWAF